MYININIDMFMNVNINANINIVIDMKTYEARNKKKELCTNIDPCRTVKKTVASLSVYCNHLNSPKLEDGYFFWSLWSIISKTNVAKAIIS